MSDYVSRLYCVSLSYANKAQPSSKCVWAMTFVQRDNWWRTVQLEDISHPDPASADWSLMFRLGPYWLTLVTPDDIMSPAPDTKYLTMAAALSFDELTSNNDRGEALKDVIETYLSEMFGENICILQAKYYVQQIRKYFT